MDSIDVDLLVVGSGAGALTAAITAHDHGGKVLVVEKSDMYGGTSATSGGGIWIPCNHLMAEHGEDDTAEAALEYLEACIGDTVSKFETVPVGMFNVSTTLYKSCCLRSARSNSSWGIF